MENTEETKVENDVDKAPMGQHEYEVRLRLGGVVTVRADRITEHEGALTFYRNAIPTEEKPKPLRSDGEAVASVAPVTWSFWRLIR